MSWSAPIAWSVDLSIGKHLYFMRAASLDLIKIGCAREPERRLLALHHTSPVPLELLLRVPGTHADEWHLHWLFRRQRTHREWFRSSPDLIEMIDNLRAGVPLVSLVGEPPLTVKDREMLRRRAA